MSQPVLVATLDVPYECAFRKAGSMNGLPSYPVPPITTIQGLLYNALGRPSLLKPNQLDKSAREEEEEFRDRVQQDCDFGLRVIDAGQRVTGLRSRQKVTSSKDDYAYLTYPTKAETLIRPTYRMYVGGPSDLINSFVSGLQSPQRPLSLGRSDDMVVIRDVEDTTATKVTEIAQLNCVTPGEGNNTTLLPVAPDYRGTYTEHPGELKTVAIDGGKVDEYLETESGERFVYVT